jgi:transposase
MLGIDVSKRELTTTLLDPLTQQATWTLTVANTAAGIRQLLERVPVERPWVVEPTGVYSQLVVDQGQRAGRTVLLAPTKLARAYRQSWSPRAKTDRIDSESLAQYAHSHVLRPFPRKTLTVETVEQLLSARKGVSQAISQLRQQRAVLPAAADTLTGAIADLTARQAALDRQIAATTADTPLAPQLAALDAIPGIGPVTAAAVAACLETKHFSHPDQFVAYIGLDIAVRDSGQRHGTGHLSRQGHAELRRLLYLCAQANQRSRDPENPFKRQYAAEQAKGLSTTAALCAVARKLARTCWSIHKHGGPYDPTRVHRQPIPPLRDEAARLDTQP